MTVLFLFHSSPNYFSLFPLFFSFVYVSISLHQVSSYFLFIFYSPVLIFFLFFPTASLKCKLVYFFSFVRTLLGLWFAILSSILLLSYFLWLHLSSHSPSISSSSFCFTPFLSSFCPSSCFIPFFPLSHFQFHFLTTLFLSFFPFSYPFHFPTFFSPFSFSLFFFSTFKTTRFKIALKSIKVYISVSHLCLLLSGSWQKWRWTCTDFFLQYLCRWCVKAHWWGVTEQCWITHLFVWSLHGKYIYFIYSWLFVKMLHM